MALSHYRKRTVCFRKRRDSAGTGIDWPVVVARNSGKRLDFICYLLLFTAKTNCRALIDFKCLTVLLQNYSFTDKIID